MLKNVFVKLWYDNNRIPFQNHENDSEYTNISNKKRISEKMVKMHIKWNFMPNICISKLSGQILEIIICIADSRIHVSEYAYKLQKTKISNQCLHK